MKGDGEDSGVRDFLSLGSHGSSSRNGSGSEGFSGRAGDETSSLLHTTNLHMLSSLSKNGLSMLAGGSNSGFSLKPPAVGNLASLRNLAMGVTERGDKVMGGGFTGFYRASANKSSNISSRPSLLPGMKLRFSKDEDESRFGASSPHRSGIASKVELPLKTDVENLTPGECWRLILKLGSRWPAWNGIMASPVPQAVMMNDRSSTKDERVQSLQLGQDSLRFLASRALEALAQTPDRHGRSAGDMLAPKWTTQETAKTKAPTQPSKSTQMTLATVVQQPSLLAKVPVCPSHEMAAPKVTSSEPRTAPLTIFYAGTVSVCDNVPEDKARLIMLFAEKAGVSPNAQESSVFTDASPQVTPLSKPPSRMVRPHEELRLSKPSSEEVLMSSSVPSDVAPSANPAEGSSLDQRTPSGSSTPAEAVPDEPPPVPLKITITEGKSLHQRQQGTAKPLPNARKNSLARFLDSRKRNRPAASSSEGQPSKKPALSDSCPSDGEDVKGNCGKSLKPLCSQSSINSKEGIVCGAYNDAEMRD